MNTLRGVIFLLHIPKMNHTIAEELGNSSDFTGYKDKYDQVESAKRVLTVKVWLHVFNQKVEAISTTLNRQTREIKLHKPQFTS